MNTKNVKFLAVLTVLAMAFASFSVISVTEDDDAAVLADLITANDALTSDKAISVPGGSYILKEDGYLWTYDSNVSNQSKTSYQYGTGIYTASDNSTKNLVLYIEAGKTITIDSAYIGVLSAAGSVTINAMGSSNSETTLKIVVSKVATISSTTKAVGLGADDAIQVTGVSMDIQADATSSIAEGAGAAGIYGYSTLSMDTPADVYAGSTALQISGKITLTGTGTYNFGAFEKAIRSQNAGLEIGNGTTATVVNAKILPGVGTNGEGADDCVGVKVKAGADVEIKASSTLNTYGITNVGALTVSGTLVNTSEIGIAAHSSVTGVLKNSGTITLGTDGSIEVYDGGKITKGDSRGAIVVNSSKVWDSAETALLLTGGTIEYQDITLPSALANYSIALAHEHVGSGDASRGNQTLQYNTIYMKGVYGLCIDFQQNSENVDRTVSINNNVFTSDSAVKRAISVGTGSDQTIHAKLKISIKNNDFSDVNGFTANNSMIRICAAGATIGTTSEQQIALDASGYMVDFLSGSNTIKGNLSLDYMYVKSGATVVVDTGVTLTNNGAFINAGTITNNGTIVSNGTFNNTGGTLTTTSGTVNADSAAHVPFPLTETNSNIKIDGAVASVKEVTTTEATDIQTALASNDVVYYNTASSKATTVSIPVGKALVIGSTATFTSGAPTITINDGAGLLLSAVSSKSFNVTNGETGANAGSATLSSVSGTLEIGYGSISITGTVTAGTITTSGVIEASGLTVNATGSTVTISSSDDAKITLDGVVITAGTLNLQGVTIVSGSVANSGTFTVGTEAKPVSITDKLLVSGATINAYVAGNLIIDGATAATVKSTDANVVIPAGDTVSGTFTFGTTVYELTTVTAGDGGLTLSSSGISGNIAGATKVKMTDGIVSGLTVSDDTNFDGVYKISGRLTIAEGVTLDLAVATADKTVTISSTGYINVNGTLKSTSALTLDNSGTIAISGTFTDTNVTIEGDGVIFYTDVEEMTISGTISDSHTYGGNQAVTIDKDTTIKSGVTLTFNGPVIVPLGVEITVEQGAVFAVAGFAANFTNYGVIDLDAKTTGTASGKLTFDNKCVATNNGSILVNGAVGDTQNLVLDNGVFKLTNNGVITIGENANIYGKLINGATGVLTVYGKASTASINNSGSVIIDGAATMAITAYSKDSTVTVKNLSRANTLTFGVNASIDSAKKITGGDLAAFTIASATGYDVSGVTIGYGVEATSTTNVNRGFATIEGALTVSKTDGSSMGASDAIATIGVTNGRIVVAADKELDLDKYTQVNVTTPGYLEVRGTLDSELTAAAAVTGTGYFISTGLATFKTNDITVTNKQAAVFSTKIDSVTYYVYTTLAAAIAAEATTITTYGAQTVSSDLTVPADVKLTISNNTLTVKKGATMTFVDGSKLIMNGNITVSGKLIIENNKNVSGTGTITSDVKASSDRTDIYSSLAVALEEAPEGYVVVLQKDVQITEDLTIPDNIGLDVFDNTLSVYGATLTVDGMLYLRNTTLSVTDKDTDNKGVLKVTGIMVSDKAFTSKGEAANAPAGAYYTAIYEAAPYYCMSPIAVALELEESIEGNIALYGELSFGISEVGHDIDLYGDITSGVVTIADGYKITTQAAVDISATFGNTEGAISMLKAEVATGTVFASSAKSVLSVTGSIDTYSADYPVSFTGDVSVAATIEYASVIGDVTITDSKTIEYLDITGTVTVNNGKTLNVGVLHVTGALIAKEKSDDGNAAHVIINADSYIGVTPELGAAAIITGDVTIADGCTYVSADVDVPETFEDYACTALYVAGLPWIYIYANTVESVDVDDDILDYFVIPVTDAIVTGFEDEDGDDVDTFVIGYYDEIYATILYEIYDVTIVTDAGIKSIAIGGMQMKAESENTFTMGDLTAGTYKVTYTLKSGYEGTAVLSTYTGTVLKDNSFTLSGTDAEDREVILQLAGTEPIPEPEPTPTPEEKSEWTVTTILLCVLVVLIAIMAVIVALRLNRN